MKFQLVILMFLCSALANSQEIVLRSNIMTSSMANQNSKSVNISKWNFGEIHTLTFGNDEIKLMNSPTWDVTTYPNPFIDKLKLEFSTEKEMKVDISVLDLKGEKIYSQSGILIHNKQAIFLNLDYLVSGTYLVSVMPHDEGILKVFKVQKIK